MWRCFLLCFCYFAGNLNAHSEFSLPLPKHCRIESKALILKLTKVQHWRRQSYAGVGSPAIFQTPTEKVGVWLESRIFNNKDLEFRLITPDMTSRYFIASFNCVVTNEVSYRKYNQEKLAKEFSDSRLKEVISKKKAGVFYAWSPHMPLSMAGIKPLQEATQNLGIELILLLDPHADKGQSYEMAEKFLLKEDSLRKLESVDLMLRGLGFHYPALVVFSDGVMNDFAIPGVKTSKEYEKLILRQISSLRGQHE